MIALLLALTLGQTCVGGRCHAQVIAQEIVAAPVAVSYQLVAPQLVYSVGESERLAKLEAIAAKQSEIDEKTTRLLDQQIKIVASLKTQSANDAESDIARAARAVLSRACISCHQPGNAKGGVDLTFLNKPAALLTPEEQAAAPAMKLLIVDVASEGVMPPPPTPALAKVDVDMLKAWAAEDTAKVRRAALKAAARPALAQ